MSGDAVDELIDCIAAAMPSMSPAGRAEVARAIRKRFGGGSVYIAERRAADREPIVARLVQEGCPPSRIADTFRISERHARRLIARQKKSETRTCLMLEMSAQEKKLSEV